MRLSVLFASYFGKNDTPLPAKLTSRGHLSHYCAGFYYHMLDIQIHHPEKLQFLSNDVVLVYARYVLDYYYFKGATKVLTMDLMLVSGDDLKRNETLPQKCCDSVTLVYNLIEV